MIEYCLMSLGNVLATAEKGEKSGGAQQSPRREDIDESPG